MAGEATEHLALVRTLPCCACGREPPSQAHHSTGAGMGTRAHDHDAMPLCVKCHRDFHDARGFFRDWPKERRRTWQAEQVVRVHDRFWCQDAF